MKSESAHICVQVKAFLQAPMQGVVLETYGSGNAPDNRRDLLDELKAATVKGVIIMNCTQCLTGTVSPSYATGKVANLSHSLPFIRHKVKAKEKESNYIIWFPSFRC